MEANHILFGIGAAIAVVFILWQLLPGASTTPAPARSPGGVRRFLKWGLIALAMIGAIGGIWWAIIYFFAKPDDPTKVKPVVPSPEIPATSPVAEGQDPHSWISTLTHIPGWIHIVGALALMIMIMLLWRGNSLSWSRYTGLSKPKRRVLWAAILFALAYIIYVGYAIFSPDNMDGMTRNIEWWRTSPGDQVANRLLASSKVIPDALVIIGALFVLVYVILYRPKRWVWSATAMVIALLMVTTKNNPSIYATMFGSGTRQSISSLCPEAITPYDFDRSKGVTTHVFNPGAQCNYGFDVVKGEVEFLDIRGNVVEFSTGSTTSRTARVGQKMAALNQRVTTIRAVSETAKVDAKLCLPPTLPENWVCVRR